MKIVICCLNLLKMTFRQLKWHKLYRSSNFKPWRISLSAWVCLTLMIKPLLKVFLVIVPKNGIKQTYQYAKTAPDTSPSSSSSPSPFSSSTKPPTPPSSAPKPEKLKQVSPTHLVYHMKGSMIMCFLKRLRLIWRWLLFMGLWILCNGTFLPQCFHFLCYFS